MAKVVMYAGPDGSVFRLVPQTADRLMAAGSPLEEQEGRLRRVIDTPARFGKVKVPRMKKKLVNVTKVVRDGGNAKQVVTQEERLVPVQEFVPLLKPTGEPVLHVPEGKERPEPMLVALPVEDEVDGVIAPATERLETEEEFFARCVAEHVPVRLLDPVPPGTPHVSPKRDARGKPLWPAVGELLDRRTAETLGLRWEPIEYLVLDDEEVPQLKVGERWKLRAGKVVVERKP